MRIGFGECRGVMVVTRAKRDYCGVQSFEVDPRCARDDTCAEDLPHPGRWHVGFRSATWSSRRVIRPRVRSAPQGHRQEGELRAAASRARRAGIVTEGR